MEMLQQPSHGQSPLMSFRDLRVGGRTDHLAGTEQQEQSPERKAGLYGSWDCGGGMQHL